MFSVYPFWFWRTRDVDALREIAAASGRWRATHPQPAAPPAARTLGTFLGMLWRLSYLGFFLAVIPAVIVFVKWGNLAGLFAVAVFVVLMVTLSAVLTWGGRSRGARS